MRFYTRLNVMSSEKMHMYEKKMHTYERLKLIREHTSMTQKEFGEQIAVSFRSIQNYEGNMREIPLKVACALYTQLGINPIWFMTGKGGGTEMPAAAQSPIGDKGEHCEFIVRLFEKWIEKAGVSLNADQRAQPCLSKKYHRL